MQKPIQLVSFLALLLVFAGTASSLIQLRDRRHQLAMLRSAQSLNTSNEPEQDAQSGEPPPHPNWQQPVQDAQTGDRLRGELNRLKADISRLEAALLSDPKNAQVVSENQTLWTRYQELRGKPEIMERQSQIENRMLELLSGGVRSYTQVHRDQLPEGMTGVTDFINPEEHGFFHMNFDHGKFEIVRAQEKTVPMDLATTAWIRSKPLNEFDEVITIFADGRIEITPPK